MYIITKCFFMKEEEEDFIKQENFIISDLSNTYLGLTVFDSNRY